MQELINYQLNDYPEDAIAQKQRELNVAYDRFADQYGLINSRANAQAFSEDSSYYLLCSLENVDENGRLESKADMFTKRTIRPERAVTSVDTPAEALAISIEERGRVDLPYMSELLGTPGEYEKIQQELHGVIFKDPMTQGGEETGWVTADEYLSGNVWEKLRVAELAAASDPAFAVNTEYLKKAQPKDLDASEIDVRLGATWVNRDYIQQFMEEIFEPPFYLRRNIEVKFSPMTAEWQITGKSTPSRNDVHAYMTYGTSRANAYRILEDTLNLRDIRIYDTVEDADGKQKRVLNKKETTLAQQKQQAIKDAFQNWVWRDPYEHITGRTQAHDVIAYQIRQSFKPGEITPEEANKVGYETTMRFTKGKHAFIVATHVDRAHIHNHIIFNSTTLDCARKFRDFRLSGLALARLSDIVCLEHRLSVIIRKPYGERQKRTEYPEKKSQRDEICEPIDAALARKPKDFLELIGILREAGYEYKDGKQPALRGKGHARFARFRSLGKEYSVEELCEVIAGNAVHKSKSAKKTRTSARSAQVHQKEELSFLIDIRAKMQAGKGAGYARWAKVFNLKQMAKAMMFMEEHGIKSYAELKEKADGISEKCDALLESVKADEARMSEVSVLRKHLINYAKTKDVFAAYKASGYNREFYEAHRDSLVLRSAAKKAFDAYKKENGSDKKLPRISELNTEYSMLLERKKSSYAEYRKTKAEMQDWLVEQKIVQEILKEDEQKKEQLHEQEVRQEEENRQSSR